MKAEGAFEDTIGVVLVGGSSKRMGTDKVLMAVEGKSLIERTLDKISSIFAETIIVGHHRPEFDKLGIRSHPDIIPGCGAMGGIYTGLSLSRTNYIFVVACDMPFLDTNMVREIAALRSSGDAVVPLGPWGYEPLLAVYSKKCTDKFKENLEKGSFRIMAALEDLDVAHPRLPEAAESSRDPLHNLNTPEDLALLDK